MRGLSGFSLARKRTGIYFNLPSHRYSVQVDKEHHENPDQRLIQAIEAAEKEFNRVYLRHATENAAAGIDA
jgi:hypothetical protein